MLTKRQAYICVDIPEPVNGEVRELRRRYGNIHESIPVEVTIAGSSGVGPTPVGTSLDLIRAEVDRIAVDLSAFQINFKGLTRFPNTYLSYLEPEERSVFDHWHKLFTSSEIPFSDIEFPYNPHCTIRSFPDEAEYEKARLHAFPNESFEITTLSVYDLCNETLACDLLHRVELKKK